MTEPDLAAQIAAAVDTFAAQHRERLLSPEEAYDQCARVSAEFADHCRAHQVPAEVISGIQTGEVPEFPGITLLLRGHLAVRVGDHVYDWTIRQFDPTAPVPRVTTYPAWRREWPASATPAPESPPEGTT